MATKEAVAQLAILPERVAVVETKIINIEEKLDDLKDDVKDMHDCLDNTRDLLADRLQSSAFLTGFHLGSLGHVTCRNGIGYLDGCVRILVIILNDDKI